jgi:hypothetical protein
MILSRAGKIRNGNNKTKRISITPVEAASEKLQPSLFINMTKKFPVMQVYWLLCFKFA